jgi:hypothetical protein
VRHVKRRLVGLRLGLDAEDRDAVRRGQERAELIVGL